MLTQLVLLAQEVDCFINNYTDELFVEPVAPRPTKTSRDQARLEDEQGRITRLFNAVTRGLLKFTSSPLTDSGVYFSKRCGPNTWEEDLATAEAELAKLPIKCEETLDPADRTTQH